MRLLDREEFMRCKASDTLAVMGCGYSINQISMKQWNCIHNEFDSFGMNWYCNAGRNTTFYMVREQCVAPKKLEKGSMPHDLYRLLNEIDTTLIVKRNHGNADNYYHVDHLDKYRHDGIVIDDHIGGCDASSFYEDIFETGLRHGKCSIYDALHFAVFMGYNNLIFCGVDLYDSRYFWLKPNETRDIVANDGNTFESKHPQVKNTLNIIKNFMSFYPEISLRVQNPKSALAGIVKVFK